MKLYNETLIEYYWERAEELRRQFRVESNDSTSDPLWPEDAKEAFKLFKDYYAEHWLLAGEIRTFLMSVHSWDITAMEQELGEMDAFISEANNLNVKKALNNQLQPLSLRERLQIIYVKLSRPYYDYQNIQYEVYDAKMVYAKYFRFKNILEGKLKPKIELSSLHPLSTKLSKEQKQSLHASLINGKFIVDTDKENFIWAFGNSDEAQPDSWKPVKWVESKQGLRELITHLLIKITEQRIRDIESLFIDVNSDPYKLAKPRGYSKRCLEIEAIIKDLNL